MSTWRNAYSLSLATEDARDRCTNSFRSSACSSSSACQRGDAVDGLDRPEPENLADDGSVLEQPLLLFGERVESGGDDSLHRLGQLGSDLAALEQAFARTARRRAGCRRPGREAPLAPRASSSVCSSSDWRSRRGLLGRERRQRDRERVRLAAAPTGPALQELGARGAQHEQRDASAALDELVDEVEQSHRLPSADPRRRARAAAARPTLEERRQAANALLRARGLPPRPDRRADAGGARATAPPLASTPD